MRNFEVMSYLTFEARLPTLKNKMLQTKTLYLWNIILISSIDHIIQQLQQRRRRQNVTIHQIRQKPQCITCSIPLAGLQGIFKRSHHRLNKLPTEIVILRIQQAHQCCVNGAFFRHFYRTISEDSQYFHSKCA